MARDNRDIKVPLIFKLLHSREIQYPRPFRDILSQNLIPTTFSTDISSEDREISSLFQGGHLLPATFSAIIKVMQNQML